MYSLFEIGKKLSLLTTKNKSEFEHGNTRGGGKNIVQSMYEN